MLMKGYLKRRIFVFVLSVLMVLTMVPVAEAAEGSPDSCIGISSDVHDYSANVQTWLGNNGDDLEYMVFGGDSVDTWSSSNTTISTIKQMTAAKGITAIFTMGNHDWWGSGSETAFKTVTGNSRTGIQNASTVDEDGYTIYTLGVPSNGELFSTSDINELGGALDKADPKEPFIIVSHYPLHRGESRSISNAGNLIELLNDYPNVFFFWGHNHHSDGNMGTIYVAGDTIRPADASSTINKEINFTYCNSGHMKSEGNLEGTGVRMEIDNQGSTTSVELSFLKMDGSEVVSKTVILDGVDDRVSVSGIAAPVANGTPDLDAVVSAGNATVGPVTWTPQVEGSFLPGTVYTARVLLTPSSIPFTESTYVTINGYPASSKVLHSDGKMTVEYVFPATASGPGDTIVYKKTTAITSGHEYVIVLGNVAMNTTARSGSSSSGGSSRNYTGLGYTTPDISGDYLTFSSEAEAEAATWTFTNSGNGKWHISNNGRYVYTAEQRNMSLSDTPTSWTYGNSGSKGTQLYADLSGTTCNLCYGGASSTVTVDFIYPSANNYNTLSLFEKIAGGSGSSGSTYALASDAENGGTYVIVAQKGSSAYALSNESVTVSSTSYLKGMPVTVSGSSILADGITSGMMWKFTANGNRFHVMNGDNYLNRTSGSAGINLGEVGDASYSDWMYSTSHDLSVYSTNARKDYYLYQTSGSGNYYFANDDEANGTIYLYKVPDVPINSVAITGITAPVAGAEPDSGADTPAGSNYSAGTVSWNPSPDGIFAGNTVYSVSVVLSANGGFAFSPSTTATVNGNAANLALNPDGTATVTYTFAKTGPAPVITYERASSVTAGEVYVIVSNKGNTNMALRNATAQTNYMAGTQVTVSGDAISGSVAGDMQWTAESGTSGMFFKNNGKYLARNSQNSEYLRSTSTKPEDRYGDWRYNSSDNQLFVVGSQDNYYLYYSSRDFFRLDKSPGEGEKIYLYKKTVTPAANLTIDTVSLDVATVDSAYNETITVTYTGSGTLTYSANGLPSGLSINASTGVISGTPASGTNAGSPHTVTVTVTDGTLSDTKSYTLVVNPAPEPPAITTISLPDGMVGTAYNQTLTAQGDTPITWSISGGNLPTGLTLSPNGAITGTPSAVGTFNFTVTATNTVDSDSKALSIVIKAASVAPTITTTTLEDGTVGTAYSQTLAATGTSPITWSISGGNLPDGLTLSGITITGTPSVAGTFNFTVTATNTVYSDSKALSIVITAAPVAPTITTTTLEDGTVGTAYSQTLAATGTSPITWSISNGKLPDGLTLSGVTITGTPSADGTFNFTVAAINVEGSDSKALSIKINKASTGTGSVGGGGGGGGGGAAPTTYNATISGSAAAESTLPVSINNKTATVELTAKNGDNVKNGKNIKIDIPQIQGADKYSLSIPAGTLSAPDGTGTIMIKSELASITLQSNMLKGLAGADVKKIELSISKGDPSKLSAEAKAAIGNRPLIQLNLMLDGKQHEWNNADSPVQVSIPYSPTAEELSHPESIVVWYIDGNGNLVSVPNGRYDPVSRAVTFETTHFSYFGAGYNHVAFKDIASDAWYRNAVDYISARKIAAGNGKGYYSPDSKLTRSQFIVMLMKAYDIAPDSMAIDNFKDAGNTWYTGYLAKAKSLGISSGIGGNLFAPEKEITRQEMFVMLNNALKGMNQLPQNNTGKSLSDFLDSEAIKPWAKDAMAKMVETGIVSGSGGMLSPDRTTTRAEMAQVLYNLLIK